ncbi:MAG TPA: HNH endonuclease, partial [Kofleriaceae bacterium]|nr:HNH endonuclease [Kofleriaceae bacterium]
VAEVCGKSKAEIEVVLARRAPKPDVAPKLEREHEQGALVDPGPPVPPPKAPPPRPPKARVKPLAPERWKLEVTVSGATRAKLLRAQALMRHQVPSGDVAEVIDRALDELLAKLEVAKLGKARRPRVQGKSAGRCVPRAVRRAVVERDGERCAFVGEDGRRCDESGFLEFDHVVPVARGGEATVEGTRLLCKAHNQFEARRVLGVEVVEAGKAARRIEDDVLAGLKQMGVTATDARRAVAESRGKGTTLEERLRAALGVLRGIYARQKGWRCEEERARWG